MCFNPCCHPIQITWRFIQEITIFSLYMLAYSQLRMTYYSIVTSQMNNHMIWTGWQEGWKHVNRIRLFFQVSFRTVISLAPRGLSAKMLLPEVWLKFLSPLEANHAMCRIHQTAALYLPTKVKRLSKCSEYSYNFVCWSEPANAQATLKNNAAGQRALQK